MPETTTVRVSSAPESTTVRVAGTEETTVVAVGPEQTTVVGSGEIGPRGATGAAGVTHHAELDDTATNGHPASVVAVTPTGSISSTDVQAALAEIAAEYAAADVSEASARAAADAALQPLDSDLTAIAALSTTAYGRSLLELANAAAGRTAFGLGSAAVAATGDFDIAGAAAAAQAASQPLDSDLTAIAALSTTSYGRAFLALADAAAGRTALGLGTAATKDTGAASGVMALDASQRGASPPKTHDHSAAGDQGGLIAVDAIMPWTLQRVFGTSRYAASTGVWTTSQNASQIHNGFDYNASAAQNDSFAHDWALAAGTWELSVVYFGSTVYGIDTLDLDGASLTSLGGDATTINMYAGNVPNLVATITGIVIPTTGKKRLTHKAATTSSGGFYMTWTQIEWRRTA